MTTNPDPPHDRIPDGLSRRRFLKIVSVAGATTTLAAASGVPRPSRPAARPVASTTGAERRPSQWTMVIDLATCDGCGLCTEACRDTHDTGDQTWLPVYEIELPDKSIRNLPRPCMHCENAPCVAVCPVKATFHDPHGNVLIDNERCIGCRMCMAACPYGARSFNWRPEPGEEAPAHDGGDHADGVPRPEFPTDRVLGTVDKCMLCAHRSEDGSLPVCVTSCPMNAIWFGDLERDLVTNGMETRSFKLLISERNGFRLKEELGTEPRVWYLPGHGEHFSKVPRL